MRSVAWTLAACGLAIALCAQSVGAQTVGIGSGTLVQHDETTLSPSSVIFQRGVFRVDESGQHITSLCIPVKGVWRQVGSMQNCENPPTEMQREISRWEPDRSFLGVRNLGIATDQWDEVQQARVSATSTNAFRKIAEAFSFDIGDKDTRWRFESRKLPDKIKTAIPGSGIHVHFGGLFSDETKLSLIDPNGGELEVEARIAVPIFIHTGRAHSGLTVAVDLNAPTLGGHAVGIPVIIGLLHHDPRGREAVASDGRANFASTFLAPGNRYVQSVENRQRTSAWTQLERFVFRFTRENVRNIVADLNKRLQAEGAILIDERRLDRISVTGVTLRNESRMLDEGDVTIQVIVDYLRVNRVPAQS